MLKRYTFWLTAAVLFQFVTAVLHSLSFLVKPRPENDTERQLLELATTYRMNPGDGFHPTMMGLFTAMSACFTLICLLGGLTLGYLLLKDTEPKVMKGLIGINLGIFGVLFLLLAVFTFLPPTVCTALIFINLLAAYVLVPKIEPAV